MTKHIATVAVYVEDQAKAQALYERMTAAGVEFVQAPQAMPWGTFAQFKDEDGNTFAIKEG